MSNPPLNISKIDFFILTAAGNFTKGKQKFHEKVWREFFKIKSQFRADAETFGKCLAAEMIYFRVEEDSEMSSVICANAKEEQTNQRRRKFEFVVIFRKNKPRQRFEKGMCIHSVEGKKVGGRATKQPGRLSRLLNPHKANVNFLLGFPKVQVEHLDENEWGDVSHQTELRRHRVDTFRMDETQTEDDAPRR